jgi:hypothetical protein
VAIKLKRKKKAAKQSAQQSVDSRVTNALDFDEIDRKYNLSVKVGHEVYERLKLAVTRMAGPPATRLKWVVQFAQQDLSLLQPGEKEALGYDLRGLVHHSLVTQPGYRVTLEPMSERDLRDYRSKIAYGINRLLSEPPKTWAFPAQPYVTVVEAPSTGKRQSNRRRFVVRFGGDEAASVLGGVANLIAEAGEHLRACLGCRKAFVASAKQARYCSQSCSQRARNERRS